MDATDRSRARPDSWHPDDMLLLPLHAFTGEILGVVSVDEPLSADSAHTTPSCRSLWRSQITTGLHSSTPSTTALTHRRPSQIPIHEIYPTQHKTLTVDHAVLPSLREGKVARVIRSLD